MVIHSISWLLLVSLAALFWMSRNARWGALRDIQKTAARENGLLAVKFIHELDYFSP